MASPPELVKKVELDKASLDKTIYQARISAATRSFRDFLQYVKTEQGDFPFWDFQDPVIDCIDNNEWMIWLKRRQIMASWMIAAACIWVAGLHEYSHVALISKDEKEALEVMRRIRVILLNMPKWFHIPFKGSNPMRFPASGSVISPFSATAVGGVGRSVKLVVFDEFALHEYGGDNLNLVTPAASNSGGMILVCSTSDPLLGEAGSFYELWTKSWAGETEFKPIFSDRFCRPDQQGEEWWTREKRRYPTERIAKALYPLNPEEAFTSESGLLFGEDSDGKLIFDRQRNLALPPVAWSDCLWRVVGIDPGGSDPTGVVAVGISKADSERHLFSDRYHVYATKRWGGKNAGGAVPAQELRNYLLQLEANGPIDAIFVDPSQAALIETLRRMNFENVFPAVNDRRAGIPYVQGLFKSGQLTIHPDDQVMIQEITTTKHAQPKGDWVRTSSSIWQIVTPTWHHADCLDALRYACYGLLKYYPSVRGETFDSPARTSDMKNARLSQLRGKGRARRLSLARR